MTTHAKDVLVSTVRFELVHGRRPRGRRHPWRFRVGWGEWGERFLYSDMGECTVYEFTGLYSKAKRRAQRMAAKHGYDRLQVTVI